MKKILVTGAYGLVGSALREELKGQSFLAPSKTEVNFLDGQAVKNYLHREKPDQIIHCCARVGGIFGNMHFPATMMRENLSLNLNLFDASLDCGKIPILAYLSSCIFPNKATYPLTAEQVHDGPPHDSNFAYAHAKRILDIQAKAYHQEFGLKVSLAILTNVFGPHDYFNLERCHVIPALIHKTWKARENNEKLIVSGSGKPLREFTFSRDIARLSLWAITQELKSPLFFSSGEEFSIEETVTTIASMMKFKGSIVFDRTKPDGQMKKPSDAATLKKLHPDFVFTPFKEALEMTIDWFERNYPHVRL